MANKIALLLLAGIVITATGAGAALGLYISGNGPFAGPDAGDSGEDAATPTASGGGSTGGTDDGEGTASPTAPAAGTPTETAEPVLTPTATPTASPTPVTVPPDSFNETRIASFVVEEVNDRRAERDRAGLVTLQEVDRMAANHSRRMSEQGFASHVAGGFTTEERYRRNGLYDRCRIPNDSNKGVREGSEIETVAKVSAGSELDGQLNRDDRAVAVDAVQNWFDRAGEREKLLLRNAGSLGVGVVVTSDNRAYITVDLCS